MSEPTANDVDVNTRFEQMDRRGVPKHVRADMVP